MSWLYKLAVALAAAVGIFYAGYLSHKPEAITKTEVQVKEVEKIVTRIVTRTVQAPDGTTTTETTKETTENTTTVSDQNTAAQPLASSKSFASRYSLQVNWTPRLDLESYKPTGVEFGRRLGESNAWGVAGYDWRSKSITIGARVEF